LGARAPVSVPHCPAVRHDGPHWRGTDTVNNLGRGVVLKQHILPPVTGIMNSCL
jgi:hypothetical protein